MEQAADTRNWLLTLAYDGTSYHGWQVQPNAPTVQGALNQALASLFRQEIRTFGTSRTDSGVHALDQRVTAHVPVAPPIPVPNTFRALNNLLPPDIRVLDISERAPCFHARHDAVGKAYTYLLWRGELVQPFVSRYVATIPAELDLQAMRAAADSLIGTHDFTRFSVNPRSDETPDPVKTLYRLELLEQGPILMVTVVGNSFLYRMVRRLVYYLLAVGRERMLPEQSASLLQPESDAAAAFVTAIAQGLFLDRIFFNKAEMLAYRRDTLPFLDWQQMAR